MAPHIVIYTDNLPSNVGGCANAFVIRIRTKFRDDAGIHAHEYEHVRQWFAGVILGIFVAGLIHSAPMLHSLSAWWPLALVAGFSAHSLAYLLIPAYRLWAEVDSYKVQLAHYNDDRSALFAGFIAENYGLNISKSEALAKLKG